MTLTLEEKAAKLLKLLERHVGAERLAPWTKVLENKTVENQVMMLAETLRQSYGETDRSIQAFFDSEPAAPAPAATSSASEPAPKQAKPKAAPAAKAKVAPETFWSWDAVFERPISGHAKLLYVCHCRHADTDAISWAS